MIKSLSLSLLFVASAYAENQRTNIVFILADDLGYGDISCYGCPDAKTPNIDTLAKEGVKFTNFYANGTECTPTRTSIMTGRYPQRAGGLECAIGTGNVGRYDDAIRLAKQSQLGLPVDQSVIPGAFNEAGYVTGIFGKWHLGYEPHFNPTRYGWDKFFGCLGGNVDYFTHRELSPLPALYSDDKPVKREGYMTHLITREALNFIEENRKKPFFCYVPYTAPHFPFQAPTDAKKKFTHENWTLGTRESYVSMLEDLDAAVGKIVGKIKSAKLSKQTLIIFASDHGAMAPGRNLPFRGHKGTLFEGGIRAPLIARWPGKIKPGTVCAQLCASFDLTASFVRITGGNGQKNKMDGIDMISFAEGTADPQPRQLFWRAKRGNRTWWAVQYQNNDTRFKYIRKTESEKTEEWFFNLKSDPHEKENLFTRSDPDRHKLKSMLSSWELMVQSTR